MATKDFDELHTKLLQATCVEDAFDNVPKSDLLDKIAAMDRVVSEHALKETSGDRSWIESQAADLLNFFLYWLLQEVAAGRYGTRRQYRVEITFVVEEYEGKKFLRLQDSGAKVCFTRSINAISFCYDWHHDKARLKCADDGHEIKFHASHTGGHGDTPIFELDYVDEETNEEIKTAFGDRINWSDSIKADKFSVGDTFIFETWNHGSVAEFLHHLIRSHEVSQTVDAAFEKGHGTLKGTNIMEAGQQAINEADEKFETQQIFVLE